MQTCQTSNAEACKMTHIRTTRQPIQLAIPLLNDRNFMMFDEEHIWANYIILNKSIIQIAVSDLYDTEVYRVI